MKILLVFTGSLGFLENSSGGSLLEEIAERPTSHPSEVNSLLVAHWLQEDFGHEVHFWVATRPGDRDWLFPCHFSGDSLQGYDVVLVWKLHGLRVFVDNQIESLLSPEQSLAWWFDVQDLMGQVPREVGERTTHIAWGTPAIQLVSRHPFVWAKHAVSEHARNFHAKPDPVLKTERGLYCGRLPHPYLALVRAVSFYCPMTVYALWAPGPGGETINLRAGANPTDGDLQAARDWFPRNVELHLPVNLQQRADDLSGYLFGFVPSTVFHGRQVLSASKFFDYAGLGLPSLVPHNVPEAYYLQNAPLWVGELYDPSSLESMEAATSRIRLRAQSPEGFYRDRCAIRDWVDQNHTYRQRARIFHDLLTDGE